MGCCNCKLNKHLDFLSETKEQAPELSSRHNMPIDCDQCGQWKSKCRICKRSFCRNCSLTQERGQMGTRNPGDKCEDCHRGNSVDMGDVDLSVTSTTGPRRRHKPTTTTTTPDNEMGSFHHKQVGDTPGLGYASTMDEQELKPISTTSTMDDFVPPAPAVAEVVVPAAAPTKPKPPARTEATALHVPSEYSTIALALTNSIPGDTIVLAPGVYAGPVTIDKELSIHGDGETATVVIESVGQSVLTFSASTGSVKNITFRQAGGGCDCAVDISSGVLLLEDCCISGASDACVCVHGTARPRLLRCDIIDGKGSGLVFDGDAVQAEVSECQILDHTTDGVSVTNGANPVITGCVIRGCRTNGVFVSASSKGVISECDIVDNTNAGIKVATNADPHVHHCKVREGRGKGLDVTDGGRGLFENNTITANAMDGVALRAGCNPVLRHNTITDNRSNGVYVDGAQGLLEFNDISGNTSQGVMIKSEGDPIFKENKIYNGKGNGVYVYNNGRGQLVSNDIFSNSMDGVTIKTGGNPWLQQNQIRANKGKGVCVYQNGVGKFEDNAICDNAGAGVVVSGGSAPYMSGNKIENNQNYGMSIYDSASGTFENNTISGNASIGVLIKSKATPKFIGNKVINGSSGGLEIGANGGGEVRDNDVHGSAGVDVVVKPGAIASLTGNRFGSEASTGGVVEGDDALVAQVVKDNTVFVAE